MKHVQFGHLNVGDHFARIWEAGIWRKNDQPEPLSVEYSQYRPSSERDPNCLRILGGEQDPDALYYETLVRVLTEEEQELYFGQNKREPIKRFARFLLTK